MTDPICTYCRKPADGPMLEMGCDMAHVDCVVRELNELVDPDYDGQGEPVEFIGWRKHD